MQATKKAAWHGGPQTCVSLNNTLSSKHRAMLEASGISPAIIADRGYRTAKDRTELQRLRFSNCQCRVPGLLIPIYGPAGDVTSHQFRPDNPRQRNGKLIKYESLPSGPPRLDVPPTVLSVIGDPSVPLWITEGVKKADSAVSAGLNCLALLGVWNFKGKNAEGGSVAIGDFDQVALQGRTINIAFDSDAAAKPAVKEAEARLAGVLRSKGAKVSILRIPPGPSGEKVGLDDYLAAGGAPDSLHIVEHEPRSANKTTPVDRIHNLLAQMGVEFWHAEGDREDTYATFRDGDTLVHVPLREAFGQYLQDEYYEAYGDWLREDALKTAIGGLAARASSRRSKAYPTTLRVASVGTGLEAKTYHAMHNDRGEVVECTAHEWRIIPPDQCPVRFTKTAEMLPLADPVRGGSFDLLWETVNIQDGYRMAAKAFVASCFLPRGTLPFVMATGEGASGKSSGCARMMALVDPRSGSEDQLDDLPESKDDWKVLLKNSWIIALDNLSSLSEKQSNAICKITSGTALRSRRLYSNAAAFTIKARRPVIATALHNIVTKGDLATRTLNLHFARLNADTTRNAEVIAESYATSRGLVQGAIYDGICRAIRDWRGMPRTSRDLGQWSVAFCEAGERETMLQ
ncbi:MAG: DUF3854 domain-containing protein, partial [Armatimonadetes bacterium]|nr:DUF3854 domain-containing protein [Armatimonadota bacterium]